MNEGIVLSDETVFLSDGVMAATLLAALLSGVVVYLAIARPRGLFGGKGTGGASSKKLGVFLGVFCAVGVLMAPILLLIQEGNVFAMLPLLGVRLMQAVVLDNGFVDFIGGLPHGVLPTIYYCLIGIGYFVLPVLAALNIYDLLMQHLSAIGAKRLVRFTSTGKNVYLFNDFNHNTHLLAQDVLENDDKALVVFSAMSKLERDTWSTEMARMDSDRVRYLEMSYPDTTVELCRVFRFSKLKCLAVSDSNAKDISETCQVIKRLRGRSEGGARRCEAFLGKDADAKSARVRLYVMCDSADDELVLDAANGNSLDAGDSDGKVGRPLQLTTLNESALTTYMLLNESPLYKALGAQEPGDDGLRPAECQTLNVVIMGSGSYAEELLKGVLWCGQMHNVRLVVEVVADDVDRLRERVYLRYPGLMSDEYFDLTFTKLPIQSPRLDDECLSKYADSEHLYIVSALEDDALSYEIAMHTRLFFLGCNNGKRIDVGWHPFVACLVRDEAMNSLVVSYFDEDLPGFGIDTFGSNRDLFSYRGIIDSPLERAGQYASDVYDMLWGSVDGSKFSTEDVSVVVLRESVESFLRDGLENLDTSGEERVGGIACLPQIRHYSNLALALHSKYKNWALGDSSMSEETCLHLGENEHDRWVVFYQTEGFTYLSQDEQEMYSRALPGKNGRHKIEPLRKHSLICANDRIWANYLHAKSGFSYEERSHVPMGETRVKVRVMGDEGVVATGMKMQLLDGGYAVIEEWTVNAAEHICVGLPNGSYVLHPASAMEGRESVADLAFDIRDGEVYVDDSPKREILFNAFGKPLVNPVIYDWAFAIAAPRLSALA